MVYSLHLFQSHPRKQLIHSYFRLKEMAKLGLDVKAAMPQAEEVEDEGTLGNAQALLNNKWFSNAKNVIVRVGNYERHKQNVRAYNMALLANMFSNFAKSRSAEVVVTVKNHLHPPFIMAILLGCPFGLAVYPRNPF